MDAKDILVPLISVAGALVGLYVGARLMAANERQLDFIDRQLKEFYTPMLGIRRAIRS